MCVAVLIKENIVGLDVPVDYAAVVQIRDSRRKLSSPIQHCEFRETAMNLKMVWEANVSREGDHKRQATTYVLTSHQT